MTPTNKPAEAPAVDLAELEMQWAAFLLLHSTDILSHEDLLRRVILGPGGGRRRYRPQPEKAPAPEEVAT